MTFGKIGPMELGLATVEGFREVHRLLKKKKRRRREARGVGGERERTFGGGGESAKRHGEDPVAPGNLPRIRETLT